MIIINNAKTITGETKNLSIPSAKNLTIDASNLTIFPGLIDPHVHFRTPGMEHKENWLTAAKAALMGGYTTVFDMPNTIPPTITETLLKEKKQLIDAQLKEINIPLRYELFFGADKNHFIEIPKIKNDVIGIKVFMGCSTGNLVIDDDESLHTIFKIAAEQNLIVAVHAEDEALLNKRKKEFAAKNFHEHTLIRNEEVARIAVAKAISLTKIYKTKLYILHVSTQDEINLIAQAKQEGLPVYAETTPHHLFLDDTAYGKLNGKAVVNPPLRASQHRDAVFDAINNGIIDTIGSDHAPHTETEKNQAYGACPSGMPGIETTLALLITAFHEGKLSLEKIISLTCSRPREIFSLEKNDDVVLVDINKNKIVDNQQLKTKCGWSVFSGQELRGWPRYVVLKGQLFDLEKL